jgi:spermidine synthase
MVVRFTVDLVNPPHVQSIAAAAASIVAYYLLTLSSSINKLLKHTSLEHVDHVDLDADVIEVCRKHFSWGAAWDDPRVKLHISDGAAFVKMAHDGYYDIIVQDSSDPWTWNDDGEMIPLPSAVLYTEEHFQQLHRILGDDGILNLQAETFHIPSDLQGIVMWRRDLLKVGFERVRYGSIIISSYPTGHIGFMMCEKDSTSASTMQDIKSRFNVMEKNDRGTTYYHPKLQTSAFDIPLWAERSIYLMDDLKTLNEEL